MFGKADADLKVILKELHETQKVVEFCLRSKVAQRLNEITEGLSACEASLSELVLKKRLAFPRFFFLSQEDVLDILSNGDQPAKVNKHISKIVDGIKSLELLEDGVEGLLALSVGE